MKRVLGCGVVAAGAFAVALVVLAGGAMAGQSAGAERLGTPWTGAPGSKRTTAAIMAEQQTTGHRPARTLPLREGRLRPKPNPDSPARTSDAKLGAALSGPRLAVGTPFTGTTFAESGAIPPDSMGAVGPSQFLVVVNGRIKVFSKAGVVGTLNADLDTFFSSVVSPGAGTFTTDPRVRYDALSGKWFVLCIDATPPGLINNRVLLAVSDNGTITNTTVWTFFDFQQNAPGTADDADRLADFPTLGIDANALYVGANEFDASGAFKNTTAFVIRKSSVTGAGPIVVTAFRSLDTPALDAGPYTPQGVDNADPTAAEGYFVAVDVAFFGKLDIRRVGTPSGTPTLSGDLAITVPQTALPLNPTVSGSSNPLDGIDDRLSTASIQGGKLYTSQNIGVDSNGAAADPPTDPPATDAVRWYELSNLTSTPTLSRSGTILDSSGSATSFWMPSIAVSSQGHAVIGMSAGSASTHPDGAVASMLNGTSSFSTPTRYTASSANYNLNPNGDLPPIPLRWGDYSHTSVDACDGQTFWTIQEYVDSTDNWGVKVVKIAAPPPATPASTSPSSVDAGRASTDVTLTGNAVSGSGFWDPGSGTCRIGAAVDGGVTVNSVTFTDATHVTLNVSTVGATSGTHTVTITNPDGQTASAAVFAVDAPTNTALPTITGTASLGSTLSSTMGAWTGSPTTFTRQWERCNQAGATCTDIASATGTTYLLVQADVGETIRVRVTATNTFGSGFAVSAQTSVVTAPPANTAPPTISGLTQVAATLTAANGTWTGFPTPTFTYQWQRCDSAGASCANIVAATSQTYVLVVADTGSRIRVRVTGTNSRGSAGPIASAVTAVVVAASSGGGGGGGGGSGLGPDVVATLTADPATPNIGDTLTYTLKASLNAGSADGVIATINLPSQVTYVSSYADRGPGCTGTTTLTCDLKFLSGTLVATVSIVTKVQAAGSIVATATLTSTPGDTNTANNTVSVTTVVAAPPTTTTTPAPPPTLPPLAAPVLRRLGTRALQGVPHGSTESVAARFSTNETLRLRMSVTRYRSTRKLALSKGTRLAGATLESRRLVLAATAPHAGTYPLNVLLARAHLVRGKTYVIRITATNKEGKLTGLTIRFRA